LQRGAGVVAIALLAAAPAPLWLDASSPARWNAPGAALPAAPEPADAELAPGGRCASELRPPTTREDRAVRRAGWWPIGPYQGYGETEVLLATSSADGMCRPVGYQGFVFVRGAFAGTLSPTLMNSRSDGALSGLSVNLFNAGALGATFVRYVESDPLCCPHASTSVSYQIDTVDGHRVVEPVSAQTSPNAP
jgi:hypothetical protein